ncbi:MAG TPA: hypothetical protein VHL31_02555 [Geminicoccus sp.]|jgi:hypothetical protein|uniref:hypothetical protein n=1 Tax=Geminicoccus sp. TaxID=2024832 RepID=UPI002E30C2E8|nr:hypothetical protein [Geminicoccus sp.]HEX2525167.1 hypothetical protein [Geminicoccus sp.]
MTSMMSAKDLRQIADDIETKRMQEILERKKKTEQHERELHDSFMKFEEIPPDALDRLKRAVRNAAEQEKSEILVLRFPSDFCLDSGRAINNFDDNWPATLQGKAKIAMEFYQEHLKPLGYTMRAEILSFPNGMPGDVGLYLCW